MDGFCGIPALNPAVPGWGPVLVGVPVPSSGRLLSLAAAGDETDLRGIEGDFTIESEILYNSAPIIEKFKDENRIFIGVFPTKNQFVQTV